MDQAKNNVLQTAAFARRVVCRTLTVIGGVAAGTALAWCLSTASASAEPRQPLQPVEQQVRTVVTDVRDLAEPVTGPVETAVGTATRHLRDTVPQNPLTMLGDKVKDAAEKFRSDTKDGLGRLPGCANCVDDGARGDYRSDGYGRSDVPAQAPASSTAVSHVPGAEPDATAHRTATDRALADGMSRRGSPEPVLPHLPDRPDVPGPIPFTPTGVPTSGGHGSASNSVDSHLLATLPLQDSTFGLTRGGIAAASDAATHGRPGTQPGVAPD
ncbi:hypothetical protein [Actinophytocola sp. NPDC049390]|uniref:hypothetical protein n=1 Tax=Actinophytocola sp. NPDC049390 TaxID=3363894 RepID=UPI00378F6CC1